MGTATLAKENGANASAQAAKDQAAITAKVQAVQRHVDAYRSRDLDRFVATFAPDAEVYANGMVAKGHKQIRALYKLNFAPGSPRIVVKDSGISGPYVFVSIGYVLEDGSELCCSSSEYEVIDGKVTYLAVSG
ncbi:MAG: nuclear transport factor 2 family protein [Pseudomonadota bacterium]